MSAGEQRAFNKAEDGQQAEKEFRRLSDVLPQYMCVYGADGTPLFANEGLLDYFGFTLDDFRASDFQSRAFHRDDLARVQSTRNDAMYRGEGWEIEARIRRKDGQYRWFLIRGKPLRDEEGKIVRWFSSGVDIEDRKQAHRELEQLVDAVPQHVVVLTGDGHRLYGNQAACEYHGLTHEQFLVEPITNCFHPEDIETYSRKRNDGIATANPWEAEARLRRKDGKYRWFLIRGKALRNEQGSVVRWYLTRTDIEDRKVAELELRRLIDVVPQYIRVDDQEGKIIYANDRLLDYFGMTLEEVQATDFRARVCHPEDLDRVSSARKQAFSRGVGWEVEARLRRKDGQYRWFLNRYNPLRDQQGNIVRWYATGTDIEDRKQAERELQQLVDAVPQHIVMHSAQGRRLYANKVSLDFLGRTLQDFLDDKKSPPFHPDDVASFFEARQRGISSGMPFEMEARLRRNDGKYRWFLFRYSPHRNGQGKITGWYSTGTDIEDRKQAERELQQLVDAVPHFMTMLSGDGRRLYVNKVALDFFGWKPQDFFDDNATTRAFHQEDLPNFLEKRGRGISSGAPFELEARILRNDRQYRWFLFLYNPFRNEQGQIVRWYATGTDIEDRKRAERELQQLVDTIPHQVVVLNAEGRLLYGNRVVLDFLGWTLEEFLRGDAIRAFHPDDRVDFQLACRAFSQGLPFETEARLHRKDGQYRWFLFLYNPSRNEQGQIVRWYGTGTDIEDRKQAESALRRSEARLRLLLEFTNKLVTNLELRELLRVAAQSLRKVIACDLIGVFLPHSDGQTLRSFVIDFPESKGFLQEEAGEATKRRPISLGNHPLAEMVFRTGKAWIGNEYDVLQLGFKNLPPLAEGLKTGCVLPILGRDRVLGVLGLGRREPKPFDSYEVDLLRQVADQIAIAIVNALAVEDRRQAENALRRSEAYLEEAQQLSHTGSFAHDVAQNEIVYWSAQSYRNFGFDPANGPILWEEARARIHPDDRGKVDECQQKAMREKTRTAVDFRVLLPDGSVRHIHSQCRPVLNAANEVVELVGTNIDVTEQYTARMALEKALEENKRLKDELYRENLALKEEIDQSSMFEEIVGTSEALRRVLVQVAKVAPADSTVLITGETGTGKELIARAIHKRSERSSRAFVSVNCAAIPATLIGSELFGHEKGAFTGAMQRRLGRFELADGGTLFLDEVGDLPPETQVALLRVLQERQFERIGGTQRITVDVRIIAATNRDLKAAVTAGTFRSDLFYRLNVFPIAVPPLRERKDDIPLLVQYLTERYASKAGKKIKNIHKKTLELFQAYDWPGNIRELQNVVERAVILCDGETFSVEESWLQPEIPLPGLGPNSLARLGAERERELIEAALTETKGRIAGPMGAAAKLGIPRSTLETKIRKLGIKKHRFNSV